MSGEARADSPKARIGIALLTLLKDLHGRGPERLKVYLHEDVVVVAFSGGLTRPEARLLEVGHGQAVRDRRFVVQEAMRQRFNEVIETETGRKVKRS